MNELEPSLCNRHYIDLDDREITPICGMKEYNVGCTRLIQVESFSFVVFYTMSTVLDQVHLQDLSS